MSPAQYLISLCDAAQISDESFGIAIRTGSSNSKFKFEAAKVIHGILTFSPAPDTMAIEFLNELRKVEGMSSLVKPVLDRAPQFDRSTWATKVIEYLQDNFAASQRPEVLKPVTELATEMLSHLLIAARNPGGKKTPQGSSHPSPDTIRLRKIRELLEQAITEKSQTALKELLLRRDGSLCPFTGFSFAPPGRFVDAESAHILPFSFHGKPLTLRALEAFTGRQLSEQVKKNINQPCNAFNVQGDAHKSYDALAWGIEAVQVNDQWKYIFREIRPAEVPQPIKLSEGDEIIFNCGPSGHIIDKPEPHYCNLKLAIGRALHACGAADVINEMYGRDYDEEAIFDQPSYFGGPFISDDTLIRRLEDRLST